MTPRNILLVDDDPDDRILFLDALAEIDRSIHCEEATNGLEALGKLQSESVLPDLVFLDLNMPKMDGYEFLGELKKYHQFQSIPVIIYSTTNTQFEKKRTIDLGAKHFFTKPVDFATLKKELTQLLK